MKIGAVATLIIFPMLIFALLPRTPYPNAPNLAKNTSVALQSNVRHVSVISGDMAHRINDIIQRQAGFSGAVLVESHGQVVLDAGYGLADRERRLPFTTETVAPIGSITKQFTASAILALQQQRRLDLDSPLKRYLPGIAEPAASLKIRNLLSHTSGMAENCPGGDFKRISLPDLLSTCAALPLAFAKGTWHYSNLGYSFLAAVVESMSHQPLQSFLEKLYFVPHHMVKTDDSFSVTQMQRWTLAKEYDEQGAHENTAVAIARLNGQDWNLKGNGDMQSSARDMLRWYNALHQAPELQYIRAGLLHPAARNSIGTFYANGWFIRMDRHMNAYNVFHSGSDGSLLAYFGWWPKDDLFIYYVSNFGSEASLPTLKALLALFPHQ
jgi:CubicO group peptidase (beta-lactamase class C family)